MPLLVEYKKKKLLNYDIAHLFLDAENESYSLTVEECWLFSSVLSNNKVSNSEGIFRQQ
jgi:hypothetical protein